MCRTKAEFTIEAALVLPIVLIVYFILINFSMYVCDNYRINTIARKMDRQIEDVTCGKLDLEGNPLSMLERKKEYLTSKWSISNETISSLENTLINDLSKGTLLQYDIDCQIDIKKSILNHSMTLSVEMVPKKQGYTQLLKLLSIEGFGVVKVNIARKYVDYSEFKRLNETGVDLAVLFGLDAKIEEILGKLHK